MLLVHVVVALEDAALDADLLGEALHLEMRHTSYNDFMSNVDVVREL